MNIMKGEVKSKKTATHLDNLKNWFSDDIKMFQDKLKPVLQSSTESTGNRLSDRVND